MKKNKQKKGKGEGSKGLLSLMSDMEKKFGGGALMMLNSESVEKVDCISTGSLSLDLALGIGGLPSGRIVEIFGPESSGKTTMTLHAIASAQADGKVAAFIDAEHALDPQYAAALGVNLSKLMVSQPSSGEEALEITEALARSGEVGLIVVDSVAALTPQAELDGDMGDAHMGLQARLMGQAMRKLTAAANQSDTCIIFINQIRQKIGVMFGSNETTPGGNALKFYTSVRMDIRRGTSLKDSQGKIYGARTRVKVIKNKMAPPWGHAEFDILFGEGVNQLGELIDLGVLHGIIEQSGSWYAFQGENLGQGKDKTRDCLNAKPELKEAIRMALEDKLQVPISAHFSGQSKAKQEVKSA